MYSNIYVTPLPCHLPYPVSYLILSLTLQEFGSVILISSLAMDWAIPLMDLESTCLLRSVIVLPFRPEQKMSYLMMEVCDTFYYERIIFYFPINTRIYILTDLLIER